MVPISSTAPVPMDNFQLSYLSERVGGISCLCQHYASTTHVMLILLRCQAGCKFPPGPRWKSLIHASIYKRHNCYRAEGWRGTGIVSPSPETECWLTTNLWSNASTEPLQIFVLAWYLFPVPRQYRWTTFN